MRPRASHPIAGTIQHMEGAIHDTADLSPVAWTAGPNLNCPVSRQSWVALRFLPAPLPPGRRSSRSAPPGRGRPRPPSGGTERERSPVRLSDRQRPPFVPPLTAKRASLSPISQGGVGGDRVTWPRDPIAAAASRHPVITDRRVTPAGTPHLSHSAVLPRATAPFGTDSSRDTRCRRSTIPVQSPTAAFHGWPSLNS
jgi:hypothetical protein